MTEPWIADFARELQELDAAPSDERAASFVARIVCAAWTHAERLCAEHAEVALEMGRGVSRPEEVEIHRRRALEAQRIASELAALRGEVERGGDVAVELGALAAARGIREAETVDPPEKLSEAGGAIDDDEEEEDELVADGAAGEVEHGDFRVVVCSGCLALPMYDTLMTSGATRGLRVEIAGPIRARHLETHRGPGCQSAIVELTASAIALSVDGVDE